MLISKTLQTWFVTNNLIGTKYLESQLVSLIQMPPIDVTPSYALNPSYMLTMLPIFFEKSQQIKTLPIYQASKRPKVGKMKFGINAPKEHNYVHMPIVQPSTINHQHSPSLQDGGSLHRHKNFKELVQFLIEHSQSQTKCANQPGAFSTSNLTFYIQLPRNIHEMSSNYAHP